MMRSIEDLKIGVRLSDNFIVVDKSLFTELFLRVGKWESMELNLESMEVKGTILSPNFQISPLRLRTYAPLNYRGGVKSKRYALPEPPSY